MNDLLGIMLVMLIALASIRSCDDNNQYDLNRDGIKPVVMEMWCGTSCVEREESK